MPIKTTVSATVLEEALNGVVSICQLPLGQPLSRKVRYLNSETFVKINNVLGLIGNFCIFKQVEKQCAHFYSVTITEEEARAGIVCQVHSSDKSKFKVCMN